MCISYPQCTHRLRLLNIPAQQSSQHYMVPHANRWAVKHFPRTSTSSNHLGDTVSYFTCSLSTDYLLCSLLCVLRIWFVTSEEEEGTDFQFGKKFPTITSTSLFFLFCRLEKQVLVCLLECAVHVITIQQVCLNKHKNEQKYLLYFPKVDNAVFSFREQIIRMLLNQSKVLPLY